MVPCAPLVLLRVVLLALLAPALRVAANQFGRKQGQAVHLQPWRPASATTDASAQDVEERTAVALFVHEWKRCFAKKLAKLSAEMRQVHDVWVFIDSLKHVPCTAQQRLQCLREERLSSKCLADTCFTDEAGKPFQGVNIVYYGDGLANDFGISDAHLYKHMCWDPASAEFRECSGDERHWWCATKTKSFTREECAEREPRAVRLCTHKPPCDQPPDHPRCLDRELQVRTGGGRYYRKPPKVSEKQLASRCWMPNQAVLKFLGPYSGRAKGFLLSFIQQSNYSYVWNLEEDVDFSGAWNTFFEATQRANTGVDVLAHNIRAFDKAPEWPHWNECDFCQTVPSASRSRVTWMIVRLSKRYADSALEQLAADALGGHHEAILGTFCTNSPGCQLAVFDKELVGFVVEGHWGIFRPEGCWGPDRPLQCNCCNFGEYAPPKSETWGVDLSNPPPNKLFHPIRQHRC